MDNYKKLIEKIEDILDYQIQHMTKHNDYWNGWVGSLISMKKHIKNYKEELGMESDPTYIELDVENLNFNDLVNRMQDALVEAVEALGTDGEHHKQWSLEEIIKILLGGEKKYLEWRAEWLRRNEEMYGDWRRGIAP